jgi:hypothetical protein
MAPGSQLEPGEGIDGDGVGGNAAHVEDESSGGVLLQELADAFVDTGEVTRGNRAADG